MDRLDQLFEQFLRERTYVHNVTQATRDWYECAWKAFRTAPTTAAERPESAPFAKSDLQQFVVRLRERGVRPVTGNTWIRALNAFCRWLHEQEEIPTAARLAPQRPEKRILRTHDAATLRELLGSRPKTFSHWRVHALVATILDTGCRIEEALTVRTSDFDFEGLLITVYGKGRKERRVPNSRRGGLLGAGQVAQRVFG